MLPLLGSHGDPSTLFSSIVEYSVHPHAVRIESDRLFQLRL